jgi:predicted protein tyrosine phosphatase
MRVLFVCTAAEYRSRTAKDLFADKFDTKSAGVEAFDKKNQLNKKFLEWADLIFVMEEFHKDYIKRFFPKQYEKKRVIVLGIPDIYDYNDPELIKLLQEKCSSFLFNNVVS